jgi:hypothetical protein
VFYLDFLAQLHERLAPRTYLEFGIRNGWSLSLSRCRSVGNDPALAIDTEIQAPASLIRRTGDDYFAALDDAGPFDGAPIDFTFIDGMHLFEFALRDFINAERYSAWSSVAIFDDVCPPNATAAARDRVSTLWTGDVFKVEQALKEHRPDLTLLTVNTQPTGLLLAFGLAPGDETLRSAYDDIVAAYVTPDPQDVPADVLRRASAVPAPAVLRSPVWQLLAGQRDALDADEGRDAIRAHIAELRAGRATSASPPDAPRRRRSLRRHVQ